ncbi:hypothetical protein [Microbacterium sp. 2RAF4]|uniref:hypothetical protein n=1 Tax=Microbacterium sp. 2RAF4 TaxID=3232999 RepID=UPI003F9DFE62
MAREVGTSTVSDHTEAAHRSALAGLHVLIVATRQIEAHAEFDAVMRLGVRPRRTLRTQGRALIEYEGGGSITFASGRSALASARGRVFDVLVYVGVPETPELFASLRPCLATSCHAHVIKV